MIWQLQYGATELFAGIVTLNKTDAILIKFHTIIFFSTFLKNKINFLFFFFSTKIKILISTTKIGGTTCITDELRVYSVG